MNDDEWDQSGSGEFEGQYRRAYRTPLSATTFCGVGKKKAQRKNPVRIRVEKFICYFNTTKNYQVNINKNGLKFIKCGFKSLASARECRDEKLAGFVKRDYAVRGKGSKSSTAACFLK